MDTGLGNFAELSADKFNEFERANVKGLFKEGEVIELKGSVFRIHSISPPNRIVLELQTKEVLIDEIKNLTEKLKSGGE